MDAQLESLCFPKKYELPRVSGLGRSDFIERFHKPKLPVVIANRLDDWRAMKWTFESVKQTFKQHKLLTAQYKDGRMSFEGASVLKLEPRPIVDLFEDAYREHQYLQLRKYGGPGVPVPADEEDIGGAHVVDELQRDLGSLDYGLGNIEDVVQTIWMGRAGFSAGLHHDACSSQMLCQIMGRKRVVMIPDDYRNTTAVYPDAGGRGFRSNIRNLEQPDLNRFPLFKNATAHVGILEPGDVLYIPDSWFHEMKTLTPNISVGFRFYNNRLISADVRRLAYRLANAFTGSWRSAETS